MRVEIRDSDLVTVEINATRKEFESLDTAIFSALEGGNVNAGKKEMQALRNYFALSGLAYVDSEL